MRGRERGGGQDKKRQGREEDEREEGERSEHNQLPYYTCTRL